MRVATFNVHHGAPARGPVDHRAMTRACALLQADVLAVQELDARTPRARGVNQVARIAAATGSTAWFEPTRRIGLVGRYGIALFTRGRLLERRRVDLPCTPGREPRVAQLARVAVADGEVTVAAAHLQNPREAESPPEAIGQLEVLLDRLCDRPRPWVLLGDLNLEPAEAGGLITAAGLEPVVAGPTFPAHHPIRHIDWIAVAGLRVVGAGVPDALVSDHRPLVADLEIPYPADQAV